MGHHYESKIENPMDDEFEQKMERWNAKVAEVQRKQVYALNELNEVVAEHLRADPGTLRAELEHWSTAAKVSRADFAKLLDILRRHGRIKQE